MAHGKLAQMHGECLLVFNDFQLVMVALWNRADHYIFIPSFVLLSSFFLFLA